MNRTQKIIKFCFEYKGQQHSFDVPEEMIHGCYWERSKASRVPIQDLIKQDFIRMMESKEQINE